MVSDDVIKTLDNQELALLVRRAKRAVTLQANPQNALKRCVLGCLGRSPSTVPKASTGAIGSPKGDPPNPS